MRDQKDSEFKLTTINLELEKNFEKEFFVKASKEILVNNKSDEIEHESDSDSDFDSDSNNDLDSKDDLFCRMLRSGYDDFF